MECGNKQEHKDKSTIRQAQKPKLPECEACPLIYFASVSSLYISGWCNTTSC
jgi:hypothetical protein